jgi:hypothetical protein
MTKHEITSHNNRRQEKQTNKQTNKEKRINTILRKVIRWKEKTSLPAASPDDQTTFPLF